MRTKIINFVCLMTLLAMTACTLYPKYSRPQMQTPQTWRFFSSNQGDLANYNWWKLLGDPILDQYIAEALANNQDLKVAIYRVDEYAARLGIVRSQLYPQLSGQADGGRGKISTTLEPISPGVQSISNTYAMILNASYELDIWGKIRSASDAAKAQLFAQIYNRQTVVLTLVGAVASSYIDLRRLDEQLFIARKTLVLRQEAYRLAVVRFNLGLTSKIEVEQAQSEVEATQVFIDRYVLEIALVEDLLAVLMGKPPTTIERGRLLTQLSKPSQIPTLLPSELVSQRPDILASEQELIAANADIGVARARFFPQISLAALLGTETSFFSQLFQRQSNVWEYGATLLQEIFTGGRLTSGLRLAKAKKMEMLYSYQSTILNAFKEVNDALIEMQKTDEIALVQQERVATLAEYLYLATLRYNEGQIDYLTFMDAERQLFNAEVEAIKAKGDSFLALVNLYKALGGGWVVDADRNGLQLNGR